MSFNQLPHAAAARLDSPVGSPVGKALKVLHMKPVNMFVLLSWVITSTIIGLALFSIPYMKKIASGKAIESFSSTIFAIIIFSLIFGIPWFRLALAESNKHQPARKIAFSCLSILIAIYFSTQISTAQDVGIGLNIIFFVFCVWLIYPFTRLFNRNV